MFSYQSREWLARAAKAASRQARRHIVNLSEAKLSLVETMLPQITEYRWCRCAYGKHPYPSRTRWLRHKRPMVTLPGDGTGEQVDATFKKENIGTHSNV